MCVKQKVSSRSGSITKLLFQALDEERQSHGELRVKFQKLTLEHADVKGQVKLDNYKVENYDRLKG